jgi:hypothetical protein
MNLKSLIWAVIVAVVITMGVYTIDASAQSDPPKQPEQPELQQDGIVPYFSMHMWVGEDYKTSTPTTDRHKTFLINPSPSGNTKVGVKGKSGSLFVDGSVALLYLPYNYTVSVGDADFFAKYVFAEDLYLKVGHYAVPWAGVNIFDSANDDGMINECASGEPPIYQFIASFKGFYIDIMQAQGAITTDNTTLLGGPKYIGAIDRDYYDSSFPKMAVGYKTPGFMPIICSAAFIYQKVTIDDNVTPTHTTISSADGKDVISWSGNATIDAMLGGFIFHLHGFYSQNQGDMHFSSWSYSRSIVVGNKIKDTIGYGGNAGIAYRIGKTAIAVGGGYEIYDNDCFAKKDDLLAYFVSLSYMLSPNFIISPVFKCIDYRKSTGHTAEAGLFMPTSDPVDEGKEYKYGVLFIANM